MLSSVDLPDPEGPRSTIISPGKSSRSTPASARTSTALTSVKRLSRPAVGTQAGGQRAARSGSTGAAAWQLVAASRNKYGGPGELAAAQTVQCPVGLDQRHRHDVAAHRNLGRKLE